MPIAPDRASLKLSRARSAVALGMLALAGCLLFGFQETVARGPERVGGGPPLGDRDEIPIAGQRFWLGMTLEEILKRLPAGVTAKEGPPGLWVIEGDQKNTSGELGTFLIRDRMAFSIRAVRLDAPVGDERLLPELYEALEELTRAGSGVELNVSEKTDVVQGEATHFRIITFQVGTRSLALITIESDSVHRVMLTDSLHP